MSNRAKPADLELTDDEIEALALKHIAPGYERLRAVVPEFAPYQQSEQFRRVKALLTEALPELRAPAAGEALNDLQALQWAEKYGIQWALHTPDAIREVIADAQRLAAPQANAERLARYCPGCGSVGPVEGEYRDCCPDGGEARTIPAPLAEKCRDTFKIAVKALRADAAANEAMANHVPAVTEEYTLRAMARNYTDRHSWDKLDSKVITAAADEIRALRAALAARAELPENGDAHG